MASSSMNTMLFLFAFLTARLLTDVEATDCSPGDLTCMEQSDDPCAGGNCPPVDLTPECPPDSYMVKEHQNSSRCACKPCPTSFERCEPPLKLKLVHSANQQPGSCCDKFECTLREVCGKEGDDATHEGASWMKDPCTRCNCRGGYSYCEQITDCEPYDLHGGSGVLGAAEAHQDFDDDGGDAPSGCLALGSLKQNGDRWREGPCTECVCVDGHRKCTTPHCKMDCERPLVFLSGECCPVCPPQCPPAPVCPDSNDVTLICDAPDLFGCEHCTCRYNRVAVVPKQPPHELPPAPPQIGGEDFTTLAVVIVALVVLAGSAVALCYFWYMRRNRGRRIVTNSHAVYDEKLSLFDVKLRPADGQQIYRQLGTNKVDHV